MAIFHNNLTLLYWGGLRATGFISLPIFLNETLRYSFPDINVEVRIYFSYVSSFIFANVWTCILDY